MKKVLLLIVLIGSLRSSAQSVFGFWYGNANVKTNSSANNYLVELVLLPEKNHVRGVLNYYFKDTYRSMLVKGNFQVNNRLLYLYEIPVAYYGSLINLEVECKMNLIATLITARTGSMLQGSFVGLPDYKYTCPDILFNFKKEAELSKVDSVIKVIREFKETYQVWKPSIEDTIAAVNILQRKVINYFIETRYKERENVLIDEIEVESDSLKVDFYDNGEIDGDSISVFFNNKLTAFHQKLGSKSIHFDIVLDSLKKVNEISMFADNLGSIPPNTALMVVNDGKTRHMIRIASSLEKNAIIKIKRKKDRLKTSE